MRCDTQQMSHSHTVVTEKYLKIHIASDYFLNKMKMGMENFSIYSARDPPLHWKAAIFWKAVGLFSSSFRYLVPLSVSCIHYQPIGVPYQTSSYAQMR